MSDEVTQQLLAEKKEQLKAEQIALVKCLDALHDVNDHSRYKLLRALCDFFGIRVTD